MAGWKDRDWDERPGREEVAGGLLPLMMDGWDRRELDDENWWWWWFRLGE